MELKAIIEAILFAAQSPLSIKEIRNMLAKADESDQPELVRAFKKTKESEIQKVIQELRDQYENNGVSFQIQEVAGSFQLISKPVFAPWLKQLFGDHHSQRLSQPALETLAIIAYRQPITRADIEAVRGVAVDGVMQTLLERGLVTITGRAEIPGRPMLHGTTRLFLERFGMNDLNELPAMDELRKVKIPTSQTEVAQPESQEGQPSEPEAVSVSDEKGEKEDAKSAPVEEGN